MYLLDTDNENEQRILIVLSLISLYGGDWENRFENKKILLGIGGVLLLKKFGHLRKMSIIVMKDMLLCVMCSVCVIM